MTVPSSHFLIAIGALAMIASVILALVIANWKQRLWLEAKKAEELHYRVEHLDLEVYNFFRKIRCSEEAAARLHDVMALASIERKIVDLKIQISINFAPIVPRTTIFVSANSTAYDALERLADARTPHEVQMQLEALDYAVLNLKEALDQLKRELVRYARPASLRREMQALLMRPRLSEMGQVLSVAREPEPVAGPHSGQPGRAWRAMTAIPPATGRGGDFAEAMAAERIARLEPRAEPAYTLRAQHSA